MCHDGINTNTPWIMSKWDTFQHLMNWMDDRCLLNVTALKKTAHTQLRAGTETGRQCRAQGSPKAARQDADSNPSGRV